MINLIATRLMFIILWLLTTLLAVLALFSFAPWAAWLLLLLNVALIPIAYHTLFKQAPAPQSEPEPAAHMHIRKAILEAVTFAAEQFLKSEDWRENIDSVLARLGESIHGSHAYIFENHLGPNGEMLSSLSYEWSAPDQLSDLDNPLFQNSPLESEGYRRFFEAMQRGFPAVNDKTTMDEGEMSFLFGRGILAVLDVPIYVNGRWWGIMGFDDCIEDRTWQSVEVDALKIAANILSAVIERQEADEALRFSEERYRLISAATSDYSFSSRLDEAGKLGVDWLAGAFERITGYTIEEFHTAGSWLNLVHPDDQEKDALDMTQLHQNRRIVSEIRIVHKDGTPRWVRVYAHPVWDEEANKLVGIYGAVQDINQRRQIEEALQVSEEKFAKAFRSSPDAVTISTLAPVSRLIDVNDSFLRMSGFTREEVIQRPMQELNIWPDPLARQQMLTLLLDNGRVVNHEIVLYTKDGQPKDLLVSAERIEIGGKPYAVFIGRDITSRKRMEEALRLSEDKFAKAFRASPDALVITPIQMDQGILDVNEGFERLTGYRQDEVLGHLLKDMPFWQNLVEQGKIVELINADGRISDLEITVPHKLGHTIACLLSAELIEINSKLYSVVIIRDISERKQMEEELKRERLLLRTVIDTLPDYIYFKDVNLRYLVSNIANAKSLGTESPEDVEGKALADFYTAEEAERYNAKDREIVMTGQAIQNEEDSYADPKTGQRRWTSMSRIPFRGSDGRIFGVVGISRDISAYKEALLEQERLIAELQAKNAELERFTYTVSHDLKSPLVTIAGFLGFIEKDAQAGNMERLHQDIAKIQEAADQMKRLLDDLLELSRIGRLINPPSETPFATIIQKALNMLSLQIATLGIDVVLADNFPTVWGDQLRLAEVMQNLLENAIKFMGDQPQPRIEIGVRQTADKTIFFVKDNGIGIAPQYHETIFGLFHRLNQSVEGTGIGLALVKRIVETHGGQIWAESEGEGQGTTFCFTLPTRG